MERFAAMVAARRPPAEEDAKENGKELQGAAEKEKDAAYLSIRLEEIVIVRNDDVASFARGPASSAAVEQCGAAAAAARGRAWRGSWAWTRGAHGDRRSQLLPC
ncbi:hypothetical protein ACP70R_006495 [Stipagrostis hirtigluma subsp. patula]